MTRLVRFGVLGCADIAWRRMIPAILEEEGVELVAVASRNGDKAKRFAAKFGCLPVTGYKALLDRVDIDAVYVPLPAVLHAEWVRRALLAGKHVLAEKPLTIDPESTRTLVDLARERRLQLMENFMFLHHSQHARIADLLAAIGELRSFASAFTIPPKPPGDIRYERDVGGGALFDIGVYPLRAAAHFLGPDLKVAGAVLRVDRSREVVVAGEALLTTPAGVTAQLSFGMMHAYRTSYEFSGSIGRIASGRVFTPPDMYQPVVHIERQDHREELVLPADRQFGNAVGVFARAVTAGAGLEWWTAASLRHAALVSEVERAAIRTFTNAT